MHYFITGGTGIIGQNLIASLVDSNIKVIALKRSTSQIPEKLLDITSEKLEWIDGDLLDTFSYSKYLNNNTTVVHAAATVSFLASDEKVMFKVNVEGTRCLVDECIENKVRKLIHLSSIASIGRIKGLTLLDENTKWQDNPDHSSYAESKYYAELEVWRGFEEGLNGFILNPSVVLACSDWTKSSSVIFRRMSKGTMVCPPGNINVVDIRDVIKSLILLDKKGINHERYICNGSFLNYKYFLGLVAKSLHKKEPRYNVNITILKVAAKMTWLLDYLGQKPILTKESVKAMGSMTEFDSSKIKNEISIRFTPIEDTISWCSNYYVEKYTF